MYQFNPSSHDNTRLMAHPTHRIRALFHGHLLADSDSAVVVRQDGEPDRYFFPRAAVGMDFLRASEFIRESRNGVARFFTLNRDRDIVEHAAWSYEDPAPGAEDLRGLITFDPAIVTIQEDATEDRLWDAQAEKMSDYIRHTDSGSGRSQDAPWRATVDVPSELLGEDEDAEDENFFDKGART